MLFSQPLATPHSVVCNQPATPVQMTEQRRIVGTFRERTVYMGSPRNGPRQIDMSEILRAISAKFSEHIENYIHEHQHAIEEKIADIEEQAERTSRAHDKIRKAMSKLRKMVKPQPVEAQTLPMTNKLW